MQTQTIEITPQKARELWRKYKAHVHYSSPVDIEIMRTYQRIAQGRMVIKAIESITAAGLNEHGYPRLAIGRATAKACHLRINVDGSARMATDNARWIWRANRNAVSFPAGSFPAAASRQPDVEAMLPIIPVHLRPKRGLDNYHILWEAEWSRIVPRDPLLLRRIGNGDLWLVVAAWDLTEVERAALQNRVDAR